MDLIELDKLIKDLKVLTAFKDGVADALLHGNRDETKLFSAYYKQGYDFGLTMYENVMENEKGADL
jgi:hypothetical protein